MQKFGNKWYFATSHLFIVLPFDLDSWDDSNPSTHQFRLYFMCDICHYVDSPMNLPKHMHLSNHPGYPLLRSQEFFQDYGDYALWVLEMVKHGYDDGEMKIPPLHTFKILWNCDPDVLGNHITTDTIEAFVDKAIAYLQELSQPNVTPKILLTRSQRAAIQTYLDVKDCDNSEGNLQRLLTHMHLVFWICPTHMHQLIDHGPLKSLQEFVCIHGGHVDMQLATLRVELSSPSDADCFVTLLNRANRIFYITIQLSWKASWSLVEELCLDIAKSNNLVLEIDGITLDTHPQGQCQYKANFFADEIIADTEIELITLLNYPRSQEQCIFVDSIKLHLKVPVVRPDHSWVDLRFDLQKFREGVTKARTTTECKEATIQLQSILRQRGFSDIQSVTIYNKTWNGALDVEDDALVKVGSSFVQCPMVVVSSASLTRLTQDLDREEEVQPFYRTMQINMELQELSILTYNNILSQAKPFSELLRNSSGPLRLTLLDHLEDTRARVAARTTIGGNHDKYTERGSLGTRDFGHQASRANRDEQDVDPDVEFLQWQYQPSDQAALFLNIFTQHHPSALTLLTLDITRLSSIGLVSIQKVLCQSRLERLHVVCTPFKSDLSCAVTLILASVRWSSLKFLAFSGDNIERWIQSWPWDIAPRLLSLGVHGTESLLQDLSHSSALFIHRLLYSSPLVELSLENVRLREDHDWHFIMESIDLALMESLSLCMSSASQLMSVNNDAVNPIIWSFGTIMQYEARLIWPSLTPDFPPLSCHDLVHVPAAFDLYLPVHVHFVCISLDLTPFELVDQVLISARWSALESLVLSGDSIDQWIQLLPNVATVQLLCLTIRGTGPKLQKLSHLSTLIIQRLIISSPLVECTIENIRLQDKRDWMLIIESIDFSFLEKFVLCKSTVKQLLSNKDTVDFLMSKIQDGQLKEMGTNLKLEMFTLDICASSQLDLATILKSLSQYRLENLRIGCYMFDAILSNFLSQILALVQWPTLEGLVLFGDNIDECIQFLHSIETPQLSRLYIHGTGTTQQTLSNKTVRVLENITSTSPHVRFHLENVVLRNTREWQFINERMDLSSLESFVWSISDFQQHLSDAYAVVPKIDDVQLEGTGAMPDMIISKYSSDQHVGTSTVPSIFNSEIKGEQHDGMCAMPSICILDRFPPSQLSLVNLFSTLSGNSLEGLYVVCLPVDPNLSKSLAQVLGSINWIALQSLVLSGENIDEWLQLWPSAVSTRLRNLTLHGEEPALQELSHLSVLFIQQLISMSPIEGLRFRNVQLQDKRDWMPIVESLDLSTLKTLGLCERSAKQFNSSGDAVHLYNSMFKSTIESEEEPDLGKEPHLGDLVMEDTESEEDTEIEGVEFEDSDFEDW
ncbi:hypothetical protein MVEG_01263 [Podila verticillata NRRL 6337]|nr:hypothetical protein MVEG_01263 [Podila verticillata NRRL 6337]